MENDEFLDKLGTYMDSIYTYIFGSEIFDGISTDQIVAFTIALALEQFNNTKVTLEDGTIIYVGK